MSHIGQRLSLRAIECADGRIYDITNATIEERQPDSRPGGYELRCTIELLERAGQHCLDFLFNFYPEAFERGLVAKEPREMLRYAWLWIRDWLASHPEAHAFFSSGRPLIIDCR